METLVLWLLVVAFVGAFAAQVAHTRPPDRRRPRTPSPLDDSGFRVTRFLIDVVCQRQTIRERPVAGLAHALVFWGFVAFGGYTRVEFLRGLGIVDLTQHAAGSRIYRAGAHAVCSRRAGAASSTC